MMTADSIALKDVRVPWKSFPVDNPDILRRLVPGQYPRKKLKEVFGGSADIMSFMEQNPRHAVVLRNGGKIVKILHPGTFKKITESAKKPEVGLPKNKPYGAWVSSDGNFFPVKSVAGHVTVAEGILDYYYSETEVDEDEAYDFMHTKGFWRLVCYDGMLTLDNWHQKRVSWEDAPRKIKDVVYSVVEKYKLDDSKFYWNGAKVKLFDEGELEESVKPKIPYGFWISKSGTVYPVGFQKHREVAWTIITKLGLKKTNPRGQDDYFLLEQGFIRVVSPDHQVRKFYATSFTHKKWEEQSRAVKNAAFDICAKYDLFGTPWAYNDEIVTIGEEMKESTITEKGWASAAYEAIWRKHWNMPTGNIRQTVPLPVIYIDQDDEQYPIARNPCGKDGLKLNSFIKTLNELGAQYAKSFEVFLNGNKQVTFKQIKWAPRFTLP